VKNCSDVVRKWL